MFVTKTFSIDQSLPVAPAAQFWRLTLKKFSLFPPLPVSMIHKDSIIPRFKTCSVDKVPLNKMKPESLKYLFRQLKCTHSKLRQADLNRVDKNGYYNSLTIYRKSVWEKKNVVYGILRSHGSEDVSFGRPGSDAVWICREIPMFRRNILPPSSGLKTTCCWIHDQGVLHNEPAEVFPRH